MLENVNRLDNFHLDDQFSHASICHSCICFVTCFTPREENRMRMFEIEVLMRKFGLSTEKVSRGWRKLHFSRCHYTDQIEENKMKCTCSTHEEMSSSDKNTPEATRSFGIPAYG
jgi:hypothetical protein